MKITVKQAIKHFFKTPSFEMIYSEAVANALDAGATHISIDIKINEYQDQKSLNMVIRDNGEGFTNKNFERFKSLLQSRDSQHKGLGRLVYLAYFGNVHVESSYEGKAHRSFDFKDDFDGKSTVAELTSKEDSYSEFSFSNFTNVQFSKYGDLTPIAIKNMLKKVFMARMYMCRAEGKAFQIDISLDVLKPNWSKGFVSGRETLTYQDLPNLKSVSFSIETLDLFQQDFTLLYVVLCDNYKDRVSSSICVDGRAIVFPIFKQADLPPNVSAIFLLQSPFFDSKAGDDRQSVSLTPFEEKLVTQAFQEKAAEILLNEVPGLRENNEKRQQRLSERYPHLSGYFSAGAAGLLVASKSLEAARERFFLEQKEILEAHELTDELYKKSMEHATRVLAEYILYRNCIIKKLEQINPKDKEAKIHDIIVPMQAKFTRNNLSVDLYKNNAWVLDDKYMSYSSVLSDKNFADLIDEISGPDELKASDVRPDIALVFSENIETVDHKVEVVIVELKKKDIGYLKNMSIIDQIKMRGRRLAALYPQKIQRMWFFGVVDFDSDKELCVEMHDNWLPLFSEVGASYYKQIEVSPTDKDLNILSDEKVKMDVVLISHNALIGNAKARNATFLSLLRQSINEFSRSQK